MLKNTKSVIWSLFKKLDSALKFPNLKLNEIGIQLGFDMSSSLTSDLFSMQKRVGSNGIIYGIDPDISNINIAQKIISRQKLNIKLIHKAVFSHKGEVELALGENSGWNQLNNIPLDSTVKFTQSTVTVPMDSLDNIIEENEIDIARVSHVNITINGSEYFALLGMKKLLESANNINLTIVAGRYDESGFIDDIPDYEMIMNFLNSLGYKYKFKRIHQLFWWGVITKLFLNRKWVFGKKNYGIIMASKGNKKLKWYQSFS